MPRSFGVTPACFCLASWMVVAGTARAAPVCFGGVVQPIATGQTAVSDVVLVGGALYWRSRGLMRMDLATSQIVSLAPTHGDFKAMDGRDAIETLGGNAIMALDLHTRANRTVVGERRMEDPLVFATIGLDRDYLYFNRPEGPYRTKEQAGLYRVRRAGGAAPEQLATEPGGHTPFVVDAAFAYWIRRAAGAWSLVRRRLAPASAVETVAPVKRTPYWYAMKIAGGRIYYLDDEAIWSAPVDGKSPPVRHASAGPRGASDLLVEPGCLYWADGLTIKRAALDAQGQGTGEVIADERSYFRELGSMGGAQFTPDLASDGRFLYWPDARTGRVMRAGRDARPPAAAPDVVARPAGNEPMRVGDVDVVVTGDGWGCGRFQDRGSSHWQCWSAAPGTDGKLAASDAAWLGTHVPVTGPDVLCGLFGDGSQCWSWSEIARGRPKVVPAQRFQWSFDNEILVGGTFTCLSRAGAWTCSGGDGFGQLADGKKGTSPFGKNGAVGTWHGCTSPGGPEAVCWGRGDGGQLGFAPRETCRVGGGAGAREAVACSRTPHKMSFALPPGRLLAGDMFTCVASHDQGLHCWGASRDGFFGTPEACPARLRQAWPTRTGAVAAPNAACSPTPVEVTGFEAAGFDVSVGPRGVCATLQSGAIRCAGAIPTPAAVVRNARVSPGDQPSACGVAGGTAVCWGAGYSPPGAAGTLVTIALDRPANADAAVIDVEPPPGASWEAACSVHYACPEKAPAPERCAANAESEPWAALAPRAGAMVGKTVRVRGPLVAGPLEDGLELMTAGRAACAPGTCCRHIRRSIAIGGAGEKLLLEKLACAGDDSRLCCDARAFGQIVVASGVLARDARGGSFSLKTPALCVP